MIFPNEIAIVIKGICARGIGFKSTVIGVSSSLKLRWYMFLYGRLEVPVKRGIDVGRELVGKGVKCLGVVV